MASRGDKSHSLVLPLYFGEVLAFLRVMRQEAP
jgi:hypothetical protein